MTADMLPDLVVIGGMKCATSALHEYLDAHPDVSMSRPKELNFLERLLGHRVHVGPERPVVEPRVRAAIDDRVHDDVDRLRRLLDDDLSEWDIA